MADDQTGEQPRRRLTRSTDSRLGGVCGGLADYFGLDSTLVRVAFVLFAFFSLGPGAIAVYAALWVIMPAPDAGAPVRASERGGGGGAGLILGVVLVLIGVSALFPGMHAMWWIVPAALRLAWPLGLIVAGVIIVLLSRRR